MLSTLRKYLNIFDSRLFKYESFSSIEYLLYILGRACAFRIFSVDKLLMIRYLFRFICCRLVRSYCLLIYSRVTDISCTYVHRNCIHWIVIFEKLVIGCIVYVHFFRGRIAMEDHLEPGCDTSQLLSAFSLLRIRIGPRF